MSDSAAHLNFSLLLNSSLDIFEARAQDKNRVDQDLGCLQHIDERLSIYGWETGTGARFAIIVDAWGKEGRSHESGRETSQKGLKAGDLKPVGPPYVYRMEKAGSRLCELAAMQEGLLTKLSWV